jgi:hypothetical protein
VPELITLRKTHFLYTSLVLAILLIILAIVLSPGVHAYWCQHFDMPEYERQFGFKLGSFELPDQHGGTYTATGVASVDPAGWFARAGIRPGDVPRMHHGISSFCGTLGAAAEGYTSSLDVVNVADLRAGNATRREVTLGVGQ